MKNTQLVCLLLGVCLLVAAFAPSVLGFTVSRMEEPEDEDIDIDDEDDVWWAIEDDWDATDWEEMMDFNEDLIADLIVEDGIVDEDWADQRHTVFTEGRHEAYTTFIVEVDPNMNEQFGPPDVGIVGAQTESGEDVQESDILRVELKGDAVFGNFEEALEMFSLRVDYYCKKAGIEEIKVSFTVLNSADEVLNITFYWRKECGSGNREGFAITQGQDDDEEVVTDGVVNRGWTPDNPTHLEPLGSAFTTFFFKVSRNMGSQDYSDPHITVSDENALSVHPVDDASNGNIVSESMYHELNIFYQCHRPLAEKEILIVMTYRLGSFNPVSFSWRKSCAGGERNPTLVISRNNDKAGDIYKEGKTLTDWMPDQFKMVVPRNETTTTFWIHSEKDYVRFSKPFVTVQPSEILRARVVPKPSGEIFSAYSEPSPISIEYKCLQKGTATVKLSVVFSDLHNPIHFAWTKECPKYKRKEEKGEEWTWTAWRALGAFLFGTALVGGLSLWGWVKYVRRKQAEAAARRRALEEDTY